MDAAGPAVRDWDDSTQWPSEYDDVTGGVFDRSKRRRTHSDVGTEQTLDAYANQADETLGAIDDLEDLDTDKIADLLVRFFVVPPSCLVPALTRPAKSVYRHIVHF